MANNILHPLRSINYRCLQFPKIVIVIVITFYSPSCLGQETAKGPFGLQVKLPPAHLSTTHSGDFPIAALTHC